MPDMLVIKTVECFGVVNEGNVNGFITFVIFLNALFDGVNVIYCAIVFHETRLFNLSSLFDILSSVTLAKTLCTFEISECLLLLKSATKI